MNTLSKRLFTGLILTIAVSIAQAVPTGAFIRRPIHNQNELIAQVKNDAIVRDRYVRHFRLTAPQLVEYFGSLHPAKLARDGVYMVYNVHPDKIIRGRVFSLRQGTLVLADRSGRAIMKMECGNPMTMGLPSITSDAPVTNPVDARSLAEGTPNPVDESSLLEPMVTPVVNREVAGQIIPPMTTGVIAGGRGGFGFLPLLLLGGAGLLIRHGGHHDNPPVPEPATLVILGTGAAAMAARKRRKRS